MGDVMQRLNTYSSDNPAFHAAFEASFDIAKIMNIPQFCEYKIKSFANYISWYKQVLTWTPSENHDGNNIYYHHCMFYFVIDLPPVKLYQTPMVPQSKQSWTFLSHLTVAGGIHYRVWVVHEHH